MIEFVFLDLDDTILDFGTTERKCIARLLEQLHIPPTDEIIHRYHTINLEHWKRLERGEITREQISNRFDVLFQELGVNISTPECEKIYRQYLSESDDVMPGAPETLARLHKKYRLFAASNSSAKTQYGRLERTGLTRYFEQIFLSEELGINKPDPLFFQRAFSKIPDFDHDKAIMVGDSLTSDIRGGINAGIQTCWVITGRVPRQSDIRADHEITSITQLPFLLESL